MPQRAIGRNCPKVRFKAAQSAAELGEFFAAADNCERCGIQTAETSTLSPSVQSLPESVPTGTSSETKPQSTVVVPVYVWNHENACVAALSVTVKIVSLPDTAVLTSKTYVLLHNENTA